MTYSSVALLVDGDNISAKYAGQIIEKASEFGHIKFRKVFGRDNSLKNWSDDKSYTRIEVEPLKNAADFQLSFDAVEMAATGKVDSFVIVSSDKDLAHVVQG